MLFNKAFVVLCSLMIGIMFFGSSMNKKNAEKCGTVIILNGPSAVGKSSIIKAFQSKQSKPWLGIGIDNFFVGVLPPKFYLEDTPEHRTVMHGVTSVDAEGKLFTLHVGPEGYKIVKGMHQAIAAYARTGNNVIVDYIMYEPSWYTDLQSSLTGINVITVGITASLETIKEREKKRATSPEGHARSLYESVHRGWKYDLQINTDDVTADQAAQLIVNHLE